MAKLIPVILALLGIVAGGAIGFVLKPAPEPTEAAENGGAAHGENQAGGHDGGNSGGHGAESGGDHGRAAIGAPTMASDSEYMPLSRKMIVPFRRDNGHKAFVAIDINLEIAPGKLHHAEAHEPKLVDAFLRTLVAFAATGAFDDDTQAAHTLQELNHELLAAAQAVLGHAVRQVLIANLITQDA